MHDGRCLVDQGLQCRSGPLPPTCSSELEPGHQRLERKSSFICLLKEWTDPALFSSLGRLFHALITLLLKKFRLNSVLGFCRTKLSGSLASLVIRAGLSPIIVNQKEGKVSLSVATPGKGQISPAVSFSR